MTFSSAHRSHILRDCAASTRRTQVTSLVALGLLLMGACGAHAATLVVNTTKSTNDGVCSTSAGGCSLPDAIAVSNANGNAVADTITFNIPKSDSGFNASTGVFSIKATTDLPAVAQGLVTIDGTTQTTFTGNSNVNGPEVEIAAGASISNGLTLSSNSNTVRNLMVNGFGAQIEVGGNANTIESCYIGVDSTGTRASSTNNRYYTDYTGINASSRSNTVIGGNTAAKGNLIGYGQKGINLQFCSSSTIQNNTVRNQSGGAIYIYSSTGTSTTFNTITGVKGSAVSIYGGGSGNLVRQNSIYGNAGLGIDLEADGVTANDVGDGDSGSNLLQNFPLITAATTSGSNTTVQFSLNSLASATFAIDVYRSDATEVGSSGYGPGKTWVGQTNITTDASGNATGSLSVAGVSASSFYCATATNGSNTSEFSFARQTNGSSGFIVTNTKDAGTGSLRNAINFVNYSGATTAITFNIPQTDAGYNASTGVFTITALSALPTISRNGVTLDGATQTTFGGNTNTRGPEIEVTAGASITTGLNLIGSNGIVRNLLVNGFTNQIQVSGDSSTVESCYLGVDSTGTKASGANGRYSTHFAGVNASSHSNIVIGGNTAAKGNLIGYGQCAINLISCPNTTIQNNTLRDQSGGGIQIYSSTNTTTTFNTISGVKGIAVSIYGGGSGNLVRQNSISGNGGLGIDLEADGLTVNDAGDADTGANELQNFPVITGAATSGGNTTVQISLNSLADTTFAIDIYRTPTDQLSSSGYGPGMTWVGQTSLTTDSSGNGSTNLNVVGNVANSSYVATATTGNSTSEFSFASQTNGASGSVVTNTNSSGPGSLAAAINYVNYSGGSAGVVFNIPTSDSGYNSSTGVFTITLQSALPTIMRDGVTLDGGTQTIFTGNTNVYGPEVEITNGAGLATGLALTSKNNVVKNLMVNSFAIQIEVGGNSTTVESCYIGVDSTGTQQAGTNNLYLTPYIGINAKGRTGIVIGGNTAAKGNLIGYGQRGINLDVCANSIVQYNTVRNQSERGLFLYYCNNMSITFNTITGVKGSAISSDGGNNNRMRQNSIYGNTGLGIDLGNDGVTANDKGDGDSGSNMLQNFPIITGVSMSGGDTTIQLSLNSLVNLPFLIDVYRLDANEVSPGGYGPGKTWVGQTYIITGNDGNGSASLTVSGDSASSFYCATASYGNNTSEFSFARQTNGAAGSVVTNTNNTGVGSLRNALSFVNESGGASAITFNIPQTDPGYNPITGVFTITVLDSVLFLEASNVTLDGATQTAFGGNTNVYGPEVEIMDGDYLSNGLILSGSSNVVKNLMFNGFGTQINVGGDSATIESCYLGVDFTGTEQHSNDFYSANHTGIRASFRSSTVIGGNTAAKGNIIGYGQSGLILEFCDNSTIQNNEIGQQSYVGLSLSSCTNSSVLFNSIHDVDGPAVTIYGNGNVNGNLVRRNSIYNNTGLGIDLDNNGVTANDAGDGDTGANDLQNFPFLTGAAMSGSNTTVQFSLNSLANTTYTIDIYRTPTDELSGTGYGPGKTWVGQTSVTTDSSGNASSSLVVGNAANSSYVATATDPYNSTSEFSLAQAGTAASGAPSVGSATPASGSTGNGVARTISVTYSDPNGVSDIAMARLLISADANSTSASLYGAYDAIANKLYLYNDAGTDLLGGFTPGSSNVISNSQGSLNCQSTTVSTSGNTLTVNWNFTSKAPFSGAKNLYGLVSDKGGLVDGLVQIGTWTILGPPTNGSVTPASGSSGTGVQRILTATYSDGDGTNDLSVVRLLVNGSLATNNGLYGYYDVVANKLYLQNDAGTALLGGFTPGSANVISNSQGSLNCQYTTVSVSGNTLTVNWAFTPNTTFKGAKNLYLRATDKSNNNSPWEAKGTWTISNMPTNGSVTPASGSSGTGVQRILTATYSDSDGVSDLSVARLLVNSTLVTNNGLYGYYDVVANKLYLQNDAGTALLGGFTPGTANVISNSQGSLNCQATTVSSSGNTLTLNWAFTPNTTFKGAKNLYLRATDKANNNSPWEAKGTWTVSDPAGVQNPSQSSVFSPSANNS